MKLTKRIMLITGLVAVLIAGAVLAVAGAQHRRGLVGSFGPGHQFRLERMLDRASVYLGLSQEQETQIRAILTAAKPVVQPLVMQLAENKKALEATTANGNFDEAQVQSIAAKQGQTLAALIVEKERVKDQIYDVLTPEQRARAEQFRARIEARIRQHFNFTE